MTTMRSAEAPIRTKPLSRALSGMISAAFEAAPRLAAAVAFLAGAAALIITVTAIPPAIPGLELFETVLDELPDFTASVAAVMLMALAFGLRRRIDTAWAASVALLVFCAIYALVRHEHESLAAGCILAAVWLALARPAFFRRARLQAYLPTRRLYLAMAGALVLAAIGGLLWAAEQPGFVEAPWWALITDPGIGRPGRILAIAALAAGAALIWQILLAPAPVRAQPAAPDERAKALALLATAEESRPEAQLAKLGDKTFIFSADGAAWMMAAQHGGSLIAMGGPVGKRASWRGALTAFRAEAERLEKRPVIYSAPPDLLPDLLDTSFRIEKIGETAVIELRPFNLSGKAKQDLRTARRKLAERDGASFSVERIDAALFAELSPVSSAWLASQKGGEKSFSLGRFDLDFLSDSLCAVIRISGAPVAFATLWTTPDKAWAAIDLMRYDPASAPTATMDFLITETLLWAQNEGFGKFDLGLAPLSGLAEEPNAPLFAKLGRLVYERGGAFYNFEGLRRFKEKFGPSWEPRYLAATGAFAMPIVLAEVAMLTSGGQRGLLSAKR